jgi:hypothetical protein
VQIIGGNKCTGVIIITTNLTRAMSRGDVQMRNRTNKKNIVYLDFNLTTDKDIIDLFDEITDEGYTIIGYLRKLIRDKIKSGNKEEK